MKLTSICKACEFLCEQSLELVKYYYVYFESIIAIIAIGSRLVFIVGTKGFQQRKGVMLQSGHPTTCFFPRNSVFIVFTYQRCNKILFLWCYTILNLKTSALGLQKNFQHSEKRVHTPFKVSCEMQLLNRNLSRT